MFDRPRDSKKTWRRILIGMVALGAFLMATRSNPAPEPVQQPEGSTQAYTSVNPEEAYGDTVYSGVISGYEYGVPFTNREVQFTLVGTAAMYEGDIMLHFDSPILAGTGLPDAKFYWTDGIIPYEIDPKLPDQGRVTGAIKHWEENTSFRFILRTPDNAKKYPNFVAFVPGMGCSSYVGMIGGRQTVNLAQACSLGNTVHEIGHVVGLWHEQSRIDRDDHVTIVFENIIPQMAFNFSKHISDGVDIGGYDFSSIMHYPRKAFSKNGQDTIIPKNDEFIGQRDVLSEGDIAAAEFIYIKLKDKKAADEAALAQDRALSAVMNEGSGYAFGYGCDH